MITLYHGSNIEIDQIDLSRGLPDKDFGQGFYLTQLRHQAERMALSKCQRSKTLTPTVTVYEFDDEEAKHQGLHIKEFSPQPTEAWALFVHNNRHASITGFHHDYDIVIGPVANDGVAAQLRLFEMEYITLKQLVQKLTFSQKNSQHFFATERAINLLHKVDVFTL